MDTSCLHPIELLRTQPGFFGNMGSFAQKILPPRLPMVPTFCFLRAEDFF